MPKTTSLRKCLIATTALIAAALVAPRNGASAADIVISSGTSNTQYLGAGDTLTVTSTGTVAVSNGDPAVVVDGVAADAIDNQGNIDSYSTGILVTDGGDLYGGIFNEATGSGGIRGYYDAGIGAVSGSDISGGIYNLGVIESASGDGIHAVGGSDISGGVFNEGTISGPNAGIYVQSSNLSGGVDNGGMIAGGFGGALNVTGHSNITGSISNRAGASMTGFGAAVNVSSSSDISGGIQNSGYINGGINITNSRISGGITNNAGGVIEGYNAINMFNLTGATPIYLNGGEILGDVVDDNPANGFSPVIVTADTRTSGNFNVSSLSLDSGKTFTISPGNQVTLDHMPAGSGGTLQFSEDGTSALGLLVVSNGAIDLTDLALSIDVTDQNYFSAGDQILIADGAASIINGPGATLTYIADTSPLWDFQIADGTVANSPTDDTDLFLFVTPAAVLTVSHPTTMQFMPYDGQSVLVTNTGTISGHTNAIDVENVTMGSIVNHGTIAGNFGGAINIHSADVAGGISNDGVLQGVSLFVNGNVSGGIHNSGLISASGTAMRITGTSDISGGLYNSGTISGGVWVGFGSDVSGGVFNSGKVNNPYNAGFIFTGAHVSGQVNNTGSIFGAGVAIWLGSSDLAGGIVNGGTISGTGSGGIYVGFGSDISGGVVNSGRIAGGAVGIAVSGDISGGVVNSGVISGYSGVDVNTQVSGGITNETGGTIEGTFGQAIILSNLTAVTPITLNGGRVIGDVVDDNPSNGYSPVTVGGDFRTEGNYNVSSLSIAPGKTFTIGQNNQVTLDQMPASPGGALQFSGSSDADFGRLVVSNGAIDLTGLDLGVDVTDPGSLYNGEQFMIADGAATIVGGPGGAPVFIADNSHQWDFQVADGTVAAAPTDDSDLFLFVLPGGTASGADVLITSAATQTQYLADSESLTVTSVGSIIADPGIVADGVAADFVENVGSVSSNTSAIVVTDGGDLTNGIINYGQLYGGNAAITVSAGSNVTGGIDNEGAIYSSNNGIEVLSASNISGGIANHSSGVISAGVGVYVQSSDISGGIDNAGTIAGAYVGAYITQAGDISGGITNEQGGVISGGQGVLIDGNGDVSGGIVNRSGGTITGGTAAISVGYSGNLSGGIDNAGVISGGAAVSVMHGNVGAIANRAGGVIFGASQAAIQVVSSGDIGGGISNAGTIQSFNALSVMSNGHISGNIVNVAGGLMSGGLAGIFVDSSGVISGQVRNSGVIAGGSTGIGVFGSNARPGAMTGGIVNEAGGTITGVSAGISVRSSGSLSGGIDNAGLIAGSMGILLVNGNVAGGIVNEAGGVIATNVSGFGTEIGAFSNSEISGGIANNGQILSSLNGIVIAQDSRIDGDILNGSTGIISGAAQNAVYVNNSSTVNGTIDNRGVIKGGYDGIWVASGSDVSGGIVNHASGTISGATGMGINVQLGVMSGGIDNKGLIHGGRQGIVDSTLSDIQGGVLNRTGGVISGGSTGIVVQSSSLSGGLNNRGTVSGGIAGVYLLGGNVGGGITNRGTISGAAAVSLNGASDISGGIVNRASGRIDGGSAGILVQNSSNVSGGVRNLGTVAGGDEGIGVYQGGDISGGIANVTNAMISGGVYGLHIGDGVHLTGAVDNRGVITGGDGLYVGSGGDMTAGFTNHAAGTVYGTNAGLSISSGADVSGGVSNNGIIAGVGEGIEVSAGANVSGGISNNGSGSIGGGVYGLRVISGADVSGGLDNKGLLSGVTGIAVGSAAMTGGITNESAGTIQGTGGIAISLSGLTAATPVNINGGSIIGDVIDDAPENGFSQVTVGRSFTTQGNFDVSSLSVAADKTFTISSGNTVTLDHMPSSSGAKLAFGIGGDTDYGKLVVTNGAIDLTGLTVKASVNMGAVLTDGAELMVGDGSEAIIGGPGGVKTSIPDDSYLWNFKMADGTAASAPTDDTDLFLFVKQVNTPSGSGGQTLGALQAFSGPTDNILQNALLNINTARTAQQLNQALASLQPSVDGSLHAAALDFADEGLDTADQRLDLLSLAGSPQPVSAYAESDNNLTSLGFESARFSDSSIVGFGVRYGQTGLASGGAAPLDGYQFTLYGHRDLGNDRFLRGMAAYAYDKTTASRYNVGGHGGPTAQAGFGADEYLARVEGGKRYYRGAATVTPSLSLDWTHYAPESYTETGAGEANLTVAQDSVDTLEIGAGISTSWHYELLNGAQFMPTLHAGYKYDLAGDNIRATSRFAAGGPAFTTEGAQEGRNRVSLGAGVSYSMPSSWDFRLGYDVDARAGYASQEASLRATFKF